MMNRQVNKFKNLANVKAEPSRFVSANLQVDFHDDNDPTADNVDDDKAELT